MFSKNKRSNKRRNVTKEAIKQKKIKNNKRSDKKSRFKFSIEIIPMTGFKRNDTKSHVYIPSTYNLFKGKRS